MTKASLSPRRRRILDAATVVVADHGLRGLTHRAVDREAGLPEGSCSAYFRTRRALQTGLAEHVSQQLIEDVERLSVTLTRHPGDFDRAVDSTTRMFLRWLTTIERLQAMLELTLEATRDPELAELLAELQQRLVGVVDQALCDSGRGTDLERATTLVFASYGVLLGSLTRGKKERRAYLERSLQRLIEGLAALAPA
ncbi:MAG: TetR family transcriptional regulator [Nocardioidaceae bacterium]